MAIDTANKRMSVLNVGSLSAMLSAEPDTSVDDQDRFSLGYAYAGDYVLVPDESFQISGGSQSIRIRRRIKND